MFCAYCKLERSEDDTACPKCRTTASRVVSVQGYEKKPQRGRSTSGLLSYLSDAPLEVEQEPFPPTTGYMPNTAPLQDEHQPTLTLQLVSEQALKQLLPGHTDAHSFTAIPPMYTRPRPITPPQRIIGGLLSVLIVATLLCTGSMYYVHASGLFTRVSRIYFNTTPKNLPPTVWAKLPDPPAQTEKDRNGPALAIIPSATTTGRYDAKTYMALEPQTRFTTHQTIYLTFSVQTPRQDGRVIAKWYTNNNLFLTQTSDLLKVKDIPAGTVKNGVFTMHYMLPAEGKVELYWNNQWAQTLYFVVNA